MSTCCKANSNKDGNLKLISRNDFLFVAGAIAVIAGLLFPLSPRILDVLLIFSLSLTTAVLLITFSARSALQILGLPLLIVLATMLRMALSAACSRLILSQDNADTITGLFGAVFVGNNGVFPILIFVAVVVIIFGVICKTVKGISRNAGDFITDIVPAKQVGIDNNLIAGVIDKTQARNLQGKIARQAGFFAAMAGASRFILCAAVIELVIVIVNITASIAVEAVAPAAAGASVTALPYKTGTLRTYMTLAVGAGVMTQISALLAVVACGYVVRKSSASAVVDDEISQQEFTKRIKVVANELMPAQAGQLQYDNAVFTIDNIETVESQFVEGKSAEITEVPDKWLWRQIKDSDSYDAMAELIESKTTDTTQTILMAAGNTEGLGATVPVNIAMRLAKKGQRCLLIDLDLKRDAISKVFDIDKSQGRAVATCINNLSVWPAANFAENDKMDLRKVISNLESHYDRLVIYAPNIKSSEYLGEIADCAQAAMLFAGDELESSAISDFHKLLINSSCEILKPAEIS